MNVSIIICTRNRAGDLLQTLMSIGTICVPEKAQVELIVVDNASKDHTEAIVKGCELDNIVVRYIHEPRPGKTTALNTAIASANGDILIFTDDDVVPSPNWLVAFLEAYEDRRIDAVQGKIILEFDTEPPAWIDRFHRVSLAETELGDKFIFPYTGHLIGANSSFRKTVAEKIGGYNQLLGPGRAGFWDDSEYSERIIGAGFQQCYQPKAIVHHQISSRRLTPAYFRDAAFRNGVSSFIAVQSMNNDLSRRHWYRFMRSSLRHAKWDAVQLFQGSRPICSETELFYRMEMGEIWARLQGMERLKRRYGTG